MKSSWKERFKVKKWENQYWQMGSPGICLPFQIICYNSFSFLFFCTGHVWI